MDSTQVSAFIDYMLSGTPVAANAETGEEWITPHSPALRAFIIARLGDDMPIDAHQAFARHPKKGRALANLLREAADAIDVYVGKPG